MTPMTDSVKASATDHSFVRLSTFFFFSDRYPKSRPLSSRFLQGFGFELLFACPDPRGSSRPHFRILSESSGSHAYCARMRCNLVM